MIRQILILAACLMATACGGDKKAAPVYHTISAASVEGGHIEITDGKAQDGYWHYTFPIVPNDHYQVASVKGCGGRINGGYYETGIILADCIITASFTPRTYKVGVNNALGASLNPTSAEGVYGSSFKFAVTMETGFTLVDIYGCNGTLVGASYWVSSLEGNCAITVVTAASSVLKGTVAEGAALVKVPVIAKCSDGSGFLSAVVTDAQGQFSGQVGKNALPCALSADNRYYSLATQEGTTNITPLTTMVLALASREAGDQWFTSDTWAEAEPLVELAASLLGTQLTLSGYKVPEGNFDPFTTEFSVGDTWDQLLDQLVVAVNAEGGVNDFQELIQLLVDGEVDQLPSLDP